MLSVALLIDIFFIFGQLFVSVVVIVVTIHPASVNYQTKIHKNIWTISWFMCVRKTCNTSSFSSWPLSLSAAICDAWTELAIGSQNSHWLKVFKFANFLLVLWALPSGDIGILFASPRFGMKNSSDSDHWRDRYATVF